MFENSRKRKRIEIEISKLLGNLFDLYNSIDNTLIIGGSPINMNNEYTRRISLDNDVEFYFGFFSAISKYKSILKEKVLPKVEEIVSNHDNLFVENRIKNVNSIFSKLYHYINIKKEKGNVPINKCINDIFGLRIEIPIRSIPSLKRIVERIKDDNRFTCKVIDSSKNGYHAVHLYMYKNSQSLRWEIQFWPKHFDKKNRESHALHKQFYTTWERNFDYSSLFGEVV